MRKQGALMDCKEEIVDSRIPDPKAFEIGSKNAQILFKLNHTMPMTEEYGKAVKELFNADNEVRVIGIRHGEKMYETLLTNEECARAVDMGGFFRVPCDQRDLNYDKYFVEGDQERTKLTEFNSNNTQILNVEQVKEKLLSLQYIKDEINNYNESGK